MFHISKDQRILRLRRSNPDLYQLDIAKQVGVTQTYVSNTLKQYGQRRNEVTAAARVEVAKRLNSEGKSNHEIRVALGMGSSTFCTFRRKYGIETTIDRSRVSTAIIPADQVIVVRDMVEILGRTQVEIGEVYNVSQTVVSRYMERHGIEPRHRGNWYKLRTYPRLPT